MWSQLIPFVFCKKSGNFIDYYSHLAQADKNKFTLWHKTAGNSLYTMGLVVDQLLAHTVTSPHLKSICKILQNYWTDHNNFGAKRK